MWFLPKKSQKKNTARFTIYCMYLPPPLVMPLKVQNQIPSSSPHHSPSGAMIIFNKYNRMPYKRTAPAHFCSCWRQRTRHSPLIPIHLCIPIHHCDPIQSASLFTHVFLFTPVSLSMYSWATIDGTSRRERERDRNRD